MRELAGVASVLLILLVLIDSFQTIVLPRRASLRVRISYAYYRVTWYLWGWLSRPFRNPERRDAFLGWFGPLSLILLLVMWAGLLIVGFGVLQWSLGSRLHVTDGHPGFAYDVYMSLTTFVTLGLGDVEPASNAARVVTAVEALFGFFFLAVLVGYLPVLYQTFSQREVSIWLLAVHSGTPPSAAGVLARYDQRLQEQAVADRLREWELWTAMVLETQLSHTPLSYFRSQHAGQSWVSTLTTILDLTALGLAVLENLPEEQIRSTFSTARRASSELAQSFMERAPRRVIDADRLPDPTPLFAYLRENGIRLHDDPEAVATLTRLRAVYEPAVKVLAHYYLMPLPPWLPPPDDAPSYMPPRRSQAAAAARSNPQS